MLGQDSTHWKPVRNMRASDDVVAQIRRALFEGMQPGDRVSTELVHVNGVTIRVPELAVGHCPERAPRLVSGSRRVRRC